MGGSCVHYILHECICDLLQCLFPVEPELTILENPSSLLIPVNEIGVISCKAYCAQQQCTGHWLINDTYTHSNSVYQPKSDFTTKGFTFPPHQWNRNELILMLNVNMTKAINNTEIYCEFDGNTIYNGSYVQSEIATLLMTSSKLLFLLL